jgi:hypothetical protein
LRRCRRPPRPYPQQRNLSALESQIRRHKNLLGQLSDIDCRKGTRGHISAYGVDSRSKTVPSSSASFRSSGSHQPSEISEAASSARAYSLVSPASIERRLRGRGKGQRRFKMLKTKSRGLAPRQEKQANLPRVPGTEGPRDRVPSCHFSAK